MGKGAHPDLFEEIEVAALQSKTHKEEVRPETPNPLTRRKLLSQVAGLAATQSA